MSVVPDEDWESYSYETDTEFVVATFHTRSNNIDQTKYPHCARVLISIKEPNENGGPDNDEAEVLWAMEDELAANLDEYCVSCVMIGRLTHGGTRELIFQVTDWKTFRPPVGKWMHRHADYEIDISEHEGWDFFFDCVWPTPQSWMFIANRQVVDQLIEKGSDPEKIHSLEFAFIGPAEGLEQLRDLLLSQKYSLVDFNPAKKILVMAKPMPLHMGAINAASVKHAAECEKLGLEYDGWGCSIVE